MNGARRSRDCDSEPIMRSRNSPVLRMLVTLVFHCATMNNRLLQLVSKWVTHFFMAWSILAELNESEWIVIRF